MERKSKDVSDTRKTTSISELMAKKYAKNINDIHSSHLSSGERISDKMANFVGSWTFIIIFLVILLSWILLNSLYLIFQPFDPFPFILLNLFLSCLAAIQAPIIMMSQSRQESKDRIRSENDYEIDLKTEIIVEEILRKLVELEENQQEIIKHINHLVARDRGLKDESIQ